MLTTIQSFLEVYAAALLSLSPDKISEHYQVPMAVYSDQGVQTVTKMDEVEAFWKQGVKPYADMKIEKAVPKILSEEQLSKNISIAKVQWSNYDKAGKEVGKETNVYVLNKTDKGYKIAGLIIMAQGE